MFYIIDGYNLLFNFSDVDEHFEVSRDQLIDRLNKYSEDTGHELFVVFDAEEESPVESTEFMRVVFTPSADNFILEYIESMDEPHKRVVVTSDKAIIARARSVGAPVQLSKSFLKKIFIQSSIRSVKKPIDHLNVEMKRWLKIFEERAED